MIFEPPPDGRSIWMVSRFQVNTEIHDIGSLCSLPVAVEGYGVKMKSDH